ncbi:RadC family protein [Dellaglioa algida]|uniref:DNA repair protein RadC n=2 Tax=Dellaglioa algida TaxID=105612 RepID=A0A0R1HU86_9LACO|nr:DNA repair protein RadC [Dellaglioa algida]KRK46279.1 DNA repair protein RadC [Dellaglioa algida DSM 15638]MDK1717422.1 DNA repair protein RadC [Dellaglioa algida]MDK1718255.1 DNA repair protein RadC [Dellaglioa algida]MDK1720703.1 DNA repair protein RadC [Dellaglioa algida]MDK1722364.1 DNA repair protein RadC [Dellaglioa algida]
MSLISNCPNEYLLNQIKKYQCDNLTDRELLTVIFSLLLTKSTDIDRAITYFSSRYQSLGQLKKACLTDYHLLLGEKNEASALQLQAIITLGARVNSEPHFICGQICSSHDAGERMVAELSGLNQEYLIGLFLDTKNQIVKQETLFIGTLNSATVHPRDVFAVALKYGAAKIILVHNHPSGDVTPSKNDIIFSKRVEKCGILMGIELLDHIISGNTNYLSMKEESVL